MSIKYKEPSRLASSFQLSTQMKNARGKMSLYRNLEGEIKLKELK